MSTNELKTRIKHAYKTESEWSNSNPVLLKGEVAYSSDKNNKYKVGDGTHKWSELSYAKADLSKSDVTTALGYTPPTTNTTYSTGTASTSGLTKLYTSTGTATDGTMTQAALKTALDGKSGTGHTHDDRYYTETEIDTKLSSYVPTTEAGTNAALNRLSTGSSTPSDNDYYISQYAGGGTTTTTYHRRPISALWNYIKSKADSIYQAKGSYAPSSHSHNDLYYTESEMDSKLSSKANSSHTHTKSQITDFPSSLPASDVYSWAKASSKPSYSWSEIGSKPSTFSPSTHSHSEIVTAGDTRSVATKPSDYPNKIKFAGLKNNSNIGSPSGDTYSYVVGIRGWSDNSGGSAYEFATNNTNISYRKEKDSNTWNSWHKFYTDENKPTKADVGLGNVENKSSATIRSELTKANVTTALGYTPPTQDTNTWRPQPDWNATSGDAVIKNKPTIPSVGNGTVTITQNGTSKGTFTMNQSGNTTIALTDTDTNTDTKVTNTLATTTKAYVTGTTSASTNTGTQVFDTGVYLDTTAGRLHVTSLGVGSAVVSYDSTNKCVVITV